MENLKISWPVQPNGKVETVLKTSILLWPVQTALPFNFFFYRIWNKWKLKNLTGSVKKTGQEVFAVFDLNGKFENLSKLLTGLLSGQTTLCTSMAVIAQLNFETLKTLDRFNQLNQTTAEGAIIFRRWSWEFPSLRWFFDKNTFPKQNRIISYYFFHGETSKAEKKNN